MTPMSMDDAELPNTETLVETFVMPEFKKNCPTHIHNFEQHFEWMFLETK
jgi:hypothetical protein